MSTEEILKGALQLPRQARALLAEKLIESLDFGDEFAVSAEWRDEIQRRCQELDRGATRLVPAVEVFSDAAKALE